MRCKKIFIFVVLLLFLAAQAVPLMATDQVGGKVPNIAEPNHNDGGDDDGGEEHPWQDDTGGDSGTVSVVKNFDWFISLFFGKKKEVEIGKDQRKAQKPYKKIVPADKGE